MIPSKPGIYRIDIGGRHYFGSTTRSLLGRWKDHLKSLKGNRHRNRFVQRAFNKHGDAVFTPLLVCEPEEAIRYEQAMIDSSFEENMNLSPTAGNCHGFKHTEESRKRMSAAQQPHAHVSSERMKGFRDDPEFIAKANAARKRVLARPVSATMDNGSVLVFESQTDCATHFDTNKSVVHGWTTGRTKSYLLRGIASISIPTKPS